MREFVDKTLTNLGETESLSRNGTPDAWKAARVLLNEVGKNQDLTLRDFNNLRIRVRDILPYTASGTEEYIVNKMSQDMNDFILKLPIGNPKVVTGGDAQAGVQAWQDMNKFTMEKMKSEILGRLAYKSQLESSQGGKNITFGQALQTHVLDFLTRSSGKAMDELKLFKPSEINALEDFVAGSKSVAFDNMLNTYIGTGLAAGTTRALIRGGAVGIKSATGGGDAGTKAAFIDAIRNSGSSETIPDLTNINLSPAAATLADSMSRAYSDHQSKVDTILNAERMQTQSQQPQQGFPKSTVVPPTTGGQ